MNGKDFTPEPVPVEFKAPPPRERRKGWVLREAKIGNDYVIRVAARTKDRKGLEQYVRSFQIGFGSVAVEEGAPQESDFDDVIDTVSRAGRPRGVVGVVGVEIERIGEPEPGRMSAYVIDPDIDLDWLHIYLDGGQDASVSIDRNDTPNGRVRVRRVGHDPHVVGTPWNGSAKGEFRVRGVHDPRSHYNKSGLGTVSKQRHA
jgi:hypothetical protein